MPALIRPPGVRYLPDRMTSRECPAAAAPRRHPVAVWAPWVCAPAFLFLPIAGCGVAETLRRPAPIAAADAPAAAPRLVPITAVVTVMPPRR